MTQEEEIELLKYKIKELELILEKEREVSLRIAMRSDNMYLQLQAIREAAIGDMCGIEAEIAGEENLDGLREVE